MIIIDNHHPIGFFMVSPEKDSLLLQFTPDIRDFTNTSCIFLVGAVHVKLFLTFRFKKVKHTCQDHLVSFSKTTGHG